MNNLLFKPGDVIRLKPGTPAQKTKQFFKTGVTVKKSMMLRRTAAFTFEEDTSEKEQWYKQSMFEKIGEKQLVPLSESVWNKTSAEDKKEFIKKIMVKLFADPHALERIKKIVNN